MLCPAVDQGPLDAPIITSIRVKPVGSDVWNTSPPKELPVRPRIRVNFCPNLSQSRPAETAKIPPKKSIKPLRYPVNQEGRPRSASTYIGNNAEKGEEKKLFKK